MYRITMSIAICLFIHSSINWVPVNFKAMIQHLYTSQSDHHNKSSNFHCTLLLWCHWLYSLCCINISIKFSLIFQTQCVLHIVSKFYQWSIFFLFPFEGCGFLKVLGLCGDTQFNCFSAIGSMPIVLSSSGF